MSCHITEKLFLQMHPPTLEKIVLKVCGRKELTFSTEQIPSPWEFSFSNFPKDVLCGCSMIFSYVNMIGPPGPMKTQWPFWSSPRENKRRVYIWGAFLCMPTWWCPLLLTECVGNQINLLAVMHPHHSFQTVCWKWQADTLFFQCISLHRSLFSC